MTDEEYDVLDELYFVISFNDLRNATKLTPEKLVYLLKKIHRQGWIKILKSADDELKPDEVDLDTRAVEYLYLATKSGLLAHNS